MRPRTQYRPAPTKTIDRRTDRVLESFTPTYAEARLSPEDQAARAGLLKLLETAADDEKPALVMQLLALTPPRIFTGYRHQIQNTKLVPALNRTEHGVRGRRAAPACPF